MSELETNCFVTPDEIESDNCHRRQAVIGGPVRILFLSKRLLLLLPFYSRGSRGSDSLNLRTRVLHHPRREHCHALLPARVCTRAGYADSNMALVRTNTQRRATCRRRQRAQCTSIRV